MISKVIKAIDRYEMFKYTKSVAVALSGGADSVSLLYALMEIKDKYNIEISAIHINHQLRGAESDRDEVFVKELCEKEGIPLIVKRVDVKLLAEQTGESIELAARRARYDAFKELDCTLVATAHTADDSLETVVYNIARGTGLKGACGIPPVRDAFIRPLIFCTRLEVEEYLSKKKASFVTDSSNLSDDYTRNYIRHNVVPLLKNINPSVSQTVATMSANLREDEEFLAATAKKVYALVLRDGHLDASLLKIQPPSVIKRVIALYLMEEFSTTADAFHLEKCLEILFEGGKTSMSGNISAVSKNDSFSFVSNEETTPKVNYHVEQKEVLIEDFSNINKKFLNNAVDYGKIKGSLSIRTRNTFDEIRLRGRGCTKSLKKLMNEMKIPNELRDVIPVAADDEGVVWIYSVGVAERAAVDKNTKKAIEFIADNKS